MIDQKLSIRALSTEDATRPNNRLLRRPVEYGLRAPVGVNDGAGLGAASPAGHLEGVDDDLGGDPIRDRPADDPAAGRVDHRSAVNPAILRAVLGDVAEPEPVRGVRAELPLHEVLVGGRVGLPSAPFPAMRDPDQSGVAHEPGDAFAADVNAQT